ncbi:unnamed protein product [Echinostoma caproni]|uniref:Uncharacterized protein n=1 Tax=Echinostoma caproni TaxID=27848 RepID=A0A183AFM8_9TREM|nr:unnamed protein product [Echinostoma caproni]
MGQATGKLTISHVENKNKTEAPIEADGDAPQAVNAGQIVNGDVTNAPDLLPIDDDIEPVTTAKSNVTAEAPVAHDQPAAAEHGPNGSVNAVTEGHETSAVDEEKKKEEKSKKTKNPLVWIHRRLSKRLSTSKKGSEKTSDDNVPAEERTEEAALVAATPAGVATTTDIVESTTLSATPVTAAEHQQVVEAASSLVDQVLNTAMIQQMSEQSVEHTPEVAPITTEVVEQQHEAETEQPVLDTNNTNAEYEPCYQPEGETETALMGKPTEHEVPVDSTDANHVNGHGDFEHHEDDAVASKLANLELTNGHSEHHPTTNGVGGMHSDVIVNGD